MGVNYYLISFVGRKWGTTCYHVNVEGDTTTHNIQQYTIESIEVFGTDRIESVDEGGYHKVTLYKQTLGG